METRVIHYRYLLADDIDQAEGPGLSSLSADMTGGSVYFYPLNKLKVMVMELDAPWEDGLDRLDQGLAALNKGIDDSLLASATVFISLDPDFEKSLKKAEEITRRPAVLDFDLAAGKVSRLGWCWPQGKAFYVYQSEADRLDERDRGFLMKELALLDARLAKLDSLAAYYSEQAKTVLEEKKELDEKLSKVLHTYFVPRKNDREVLEELDAAVNDLSTAYGILAGSYRLVRDGRLVLDELINEWKGPVLKQSGIRLSPDSVNNILGLYIKGAERIKNLEDDLQTSKQNFQAGIGVVRSRIDILMSRKSLEIQGKSLVFQVAAGFIEFIIIAYYTLSLWKNIAPDLFHHNPGVMFALSIFLSGSIVYVTHLLAEKIQGEEVSVKKTGISFGTLLFTLLVMVYLSLS